MFTRTRITGIVHGLITLAAVVVTGFVVAMPAITRWDATDAEVAMSLPGDAALVTAASAITVLVLTIVQPAVWVRVVMDAALWTGVVWSCGPRRARASVKLETA
jgi:hypothetical protein